MAPLVKTLVQIQPGYRLNAKKCPPPQARGWRAQSNRMKELDEMNDSKRGNDWGIAMMDEKEQTVRVAKALTEFGGAIRGDWGSIDGRAVRAQLDLLADYLRFPETTPPLPDIRNRLDLCPNGRGHWTEYCADYCTDSQP